VAESLPGMQSVTRCGDNSNTVSDNDSRNPVVAIPRALFEADDFCHKVDSLLIPNMTVLDAFCSMFK
jgi:hypothetical protein